MPTTTFDIAVSADDGQVKKDGTVYPPELTPVATVNGTVFQVQNSVDTSYHVTVGLLRFDTSALPDGVTVTAVTLVIYGQNVADVNARSLVAEWYSGSNWPLDATDWSGTAPATPVMAATLSSLAVGGNGVKNLVFTDFSGVSLTGYTGIRLHISGSASTPTGLNQLSINAFDSAVAGRQKPQLVVTYVTVAVMQGTLAATATATATLRKSVAVRATAGAGATETAALRIFMLSEATVLAVAAAQAALSIGTVLRGTMQAAAVAIAPLTLAVPLRATGAAGAVAVAALTAVAVGTMEAAAIGTATALAPLTLGVPLTGLVASDAVAVATLTNAVGVASTATGLAAVVGALGAPTNLAGTVTGAAVTIGALSTAHTLAATALAGAAATASTAIPQALAATVLAAATATGSLLSAVIAMQATILGNAITAGTLSNVINLRATVQGQSTAFATMTGGTDAEGTSGRLRTDRNKTRDRLAG